MMTTINAVTNTEAVKVKWSHITKVDEMSKKFCVTVVADDALANHIDKLATEAEASVNPVKEKDGEKLITFKSKYAPKLFVQNENAENGKPRTNGFAWQGDKIQVRYSAVPTAVNGKKYLSLRLIGVNFLETKTDEGDTTAVPFEGATATDASNYMTETKEVPTQTDDGIPF
jgi:hypothetical protein